MSELEEAIRKLLDLIYAIDPDLVKKWIYEKWPHGIGLYE